MSKKKILIVSKFFYPQNTPRAFRTDELVKELVKRGHGVTLVIPKNKEEHFQYEKKYGIVIKDLGPLRFNKVEITGTKFTKLFQRIIRRLGNQFLEYPDIELMYRVKKALENEQGYDLLISIAYPHPIHWGVAWAQEERKIAKTWAADCGDPYMGQAMDSYKIPFYFSFLEKWFCKRADFITVPEEESKKGYYEQYQDKIKVIPQGFDFSETSAQDEVKNTIPEFAYAGTFYKKKRNPSKLLKYLIQKKDDFKFHIYTKNKELVKNIIGVSERRVILKDYMPRKQLIEKLSGMDFLLNLENKNTSTQIPSKLIDYYLTGRPVVSINPENLDTNKIDNFFDGDYSSKYKYENIDRYKIENVVNKFLGLISKN